jgi:hypothetical protein
MIRFLLLMGVILAVLYLSREIRRRLEGLQTGSESPASGQQRAKGAVGAPGQPLIVCSRCGIHVPRGREVSSRTGSPAVYCSSKCLEAASAPGVS